MKQFLNLLCFLGCTSVFSQVGVNTTTPNAAFDVNSATQGVLVSRVALTSKTVAAPVVNPQGGALANGTLVFNTATTGTVPNNVSPGFYYWNATTSRWIAITSEANSQDWLLTGNAGTNPATNFLGTTDARDLVLKTNNSERMRVTSTGNVGIGIANPTKSLVLNQKSTTDGFQLTGQSIAGTNTGTGFLMALGNNSPNNKQMWFGDPDYAGNPAGSFLRYYVDSGVTSVLDAVAGDGVLRKRLFLGAPGDTNSGIIAANTQVAGGLGVGTTAGVAALNGTLPYGSASIDGNVGIGLTLPANKFDLALGTRSGSHSSGLPFYVTGNILANNGGFEFRHNNGTQGIGLGFNTIYATGSNATQDLGLESRGNGNLNFTTNNSQKMIILGNGNVGIGTATPAYKLDLANGTFGFGTLNSRTETRDNAGLQGNSGAQSGFFETAAPTNFPTGASSWWHLIDSRHSNPTNNYALQIAGSFFDQDLWFRKTNASPTTPWSKLLTSNSGWGTTGNAGTIATSNFIGTTDAIDFVVRTSNTERMRISASGNVAIGNATPNAPLQFANSIQNRKVVLWDGNNNDHNYYGFGINNYMLRYQVDDIGSNHAFYAGTSSTTSNELMRITGTGNVGIGVTAPAQRLDVQGGNARINNAFIGDVGYGSTITGFSHYSQANTTGYGLLQTSDGNYTLMNKQNTGAGYLGFRIGNADQAVILNNGNMGVGTTNPSKKFTVVNGSIRPHVGNSGDAGIQFPTDPGGGAADEAFIRYYVDGGGENTKLLIGNNNDADDDISFYQLGAERMNIYNGNVGIGITTPWAALTMGGGAYCNSFTWVNASDARLKDNIKPMNQYGLAQVLQLKPVTYFYKKDETKHQEVGFIAQDVKKVIPEVVTGSEGDLEKGETLGLSYGNLVPVLTKAIQEQQAMIEELKKKIEILEARTNK